jgi:hypothetical protein
MLWGIYVAAYKRELADRFQYPLEQPGSVRLPNDVFEGGEDLLRQLVNESPVTEVLGNGKHVTRWVCRDRAIGEHYWDDLVYNRCLADMVTGGEWDAAKWPRGSRQEAGGSRQEAAAAADTQRVAARQFGAAEDFSAR